MYYVYEQTFKTPEMYFIGFGSVLVFSSPGLEVDIRPAGMATLSRGNSLKTK